MKVQVTLSLTVPGSFADDIIHVVSVPQRLYGLIISQERPEIIRHRINMKRFFLILSQKKIIIRIII